MELEKKYAHPMFGRDLSELEMDEYQTYAASTAIYPRVYTEQQVRQLVGYLSVALEELHGTDMALVNEIVDEGLDRIETPFNRLVYPILGLVGEAGELANKAKKIARDNQGQMDLDSVGAIADETSDVLWYVSAIATELRVKLSKIADDNIFKLASRKQRGVLGGNGDNR